MLIQIKRDCSAFLWNQQPMDLKNYCGSQEGVKKCRKQCSHDAASLICHKILSGMGDLPYQAMCTEFRQCAAHFSTHLLLSMDFGVQNDPYILICKATNEIFPIRNCLKQLHGFSGGFTTIKRKEESLDCTPLQSGDSFFAYMEFATFLCLVAASAVSHSLSNFIIIRRTLSLDFLLLILCLNDFLIGLKFHLI